jgi:hypothetical protein
MAALWLVLVGVLSFMGMLLLSAYAPELRDGDDGGQHALSRSAVGYGAMVELLRAQGESVIVSRGNPNPGRAVGLVFVTPDINHKASDVIDVDRPGPRIVVLPKWATGPDPRHKGWVTRAGQYNPAQIAAQFLRPYAPRSILQRRKGAARPALYRIDGSQALDFPRPGPVTGFQTLSGEGWTPIVVDERGGIVLGRIGEVYVLSDPDLINTQGLKDLRTARAAMGIVGLTRGKGPIVFDATLHGFQRDRSFLRLIFGPPFLGATICALAAALLMGLHAAVRFGPAIRPPRAFAFGKQALADNTAGLIRMARREHRMAERYAVYHRGAVARAIGAPRELEGAGLDAFLDRLSRQAGQPAFTDLLDEARAASNPGELMTIARKLHHWRTEMSRERA